MSDIYFASVFEIKHVFNNFWYKGGNSQSIADTIFSINALGYINDDNFKYLKWVSISYIYTDK